MIWYLYNILIKVKFAFLCVRHTKKVRKDWNEQDEQDGAMGLTHRRGFHTCLGVFSRVTLLAVGK